jgi:hypothetical protein
MPFPYTPFYDYVPAEGIQWNDANAAANARVYGSLPGHLATLTSAGENQFVATLVDGVVSYAGDPNNGHGA